MLSIMVGARRCGRGAQIDVREAARVKFVLEVDLNEGKVAEDAAGELGRVLRYWAGNLHHYELKPGDASPVYDSDYREVGQWRVVGEPGD
ncbi:hypothetical protein [Streptomyces sp. NBC_00370]|uniref:hypothetical protein n=1 Tax=Streptomyces sp. NBC_00370 TaxID=2975728 RepID=UPI002E26A2D8